MQSLMPFLPHRLAARFAAFRIRALFLGVGLAMLSLSVYLVLLVPDRAATPAPRWLLWAQFVAALAALVSYFASRPRMGGKPHGGLPPLYFSFAALGIGLSFLAMAAGLHRSSIETSASLLQTMAWLMALLLAFTAGRNKKAQQARRWLGRSVAIAITYIVLPLLAVLPYYPQHSDSAGLEKGIIVFAALLIADLALDWREITTARP